MFLKSSKYLRLLASAITIISLFYFDLETLLIFTIVKFLTTAFMKVIHMLQQ